MSTRLMIIVPDRVSSIISKGEIIDRYYNPGEVFDEVHLVLVNDDRPDPQALQQTMGGAKLRVHNVPLSRAAFAYTLGWRPALLRPWARRLIALAKEVRPQLIRCHGALYNAFAAAEIKRTLGIPYVVSLHINPDEDVRGRAGSLLKRVVTHAQQDIERIALLNADLVMPVYRPIVPYLQRLGVTRYEVCYNALNPRNLVKKDDYRLGDPVRVISIGRQFREKNPDNLIRAVARISNMELTLVGDGSYHQHLKDVAEECGIANRVHFLPAVPNDELCRQLPDYDVFATHSEYWEIAKSVLEPLLTGLPVVINRRHGEPVPELSEDICLLVDNTVDDYERALRRLVTDHAFREQLGRAAYAHAQANWAPAVTEQKFGDIYRRLMKN